MSCWSAGQILGYKHPAHTRLMLESCEHRCCARCNWEPRCCARCNCEHLCSARCSSAKSWLFGQLLHSSMAIDAAKEVSPVEVAEDVSCACLCISTPQQVMKTMHVTQHAIQEDAGWCNAIAGERLCIGPWTRKLTLQTRFSCSVSQSRSVQSLEAARPFDQIAQSFSRQQHKQRMTQTNMISFRKVVVMRGKPRPSSGNCHCA